MRSWIEHYERGLRALGKSRRPEAVRHFRVAASVVEVNSNPLLAGTLFMKLSVAEMACDQLDNACIAAERAILIAQEHLEETEGQDLFVASTTVFACTQAVRADFNGARGVLKELLAQIESFDRPDLAAAPLEALADMDLDNEDYPQAQRLYMRAYEIRRKFDPESEKMSALLERLTEACNLNEDWEEAERFDELYTALLKKKILAKGDPKGRALVEKHDRLLAETKKLRGNAVIEEAVQATLVPMARTGSFPLALKVGPVGYNISGY